ncbi:TIR domain-containing protein [Bowmanella yangjiangensis]|uniref:TIR domain-containing protein n=1 Tax=Bowmanella yangjiangensis TaxID=2811230 RepID=A0ABS3CSH1_9ALTE|nr:TIR domain-containing protein [Bowmanella yangjiangensis]MBN7820067.1 TIR domain-containing protein [Bowmanella yangjiangensis]
MSKKVFISYSHRDEDHREDFGDHLSMMQRNGVIECWHDRKIHVSDDWKNEIDQNLESADIIIFLVSPSFLASEYCFDVEVKRAMERQKEGTAQIISIVVRPCDWEDCEFSKFQAAPKDAKPITRWEDRDEAWLNVVQSIKKHINEFKPKLEIQTGIEVLTGPSQENLEWLSDTEIVLTHRRVDRVLLEGIFVVPDVELESTNDLVNIKSANYMLNHMGHYLISGEEQQGKTSLLKYIYRSSLKKGYLPVYINAPEVKKASVEEEIKKRLGSQYVNLDYDTFLSHKEIMVLVDNIDEIGLNKKFKSAFLDQLNKITQFTFVTCHSSYSYISGDIPSLDEHERVELLGLGNKKREELIQKWISLGVEESIEEKELYSKCDELKNNLNTVIKKNIVPPKPIYVLMLLQMFEANSKLDLELTSFGHCYQQLIYQSFDNANISKQDFDKYLNVLTELAWKIFTSQEELNLSQIDIFFKKYNEVYLPVKREKVLKKLIEHAVLRDNGLTVGFKYPYIYYFFVGKKIAESYSENLETRDQFEELLKKLHREDFANILIFITHHTKEPWVLKNIKTVLQTLFEQQDEARLDKKQLSFMDDFMKSIPELIVEQREIQKERDEQNENLDRIERSTEIEESEPLDILASINKTFKGMEVAGQIIRNRHATLTRQAMEDLAKVSASAGLRFLDYFIKINDAAKNEILKLISAQLAEHPNLSNKEIEKEAENVYLHLTYGVINAFTRKIASSIGSKDALEVYRQVDKRAGTPAFNLIRQAIELQFNKSIDIDQISECVKSLHGNEVCLRILKEMIIQHIYLFPVDYKEKQQLSELLCISVQGQRWMDMKKAGKG